MRKSGLYRLTHFYSYGGLAGSCVNTPGNAANTVVFPLTVVDLAIAVMVGDGCCAFASMALGSNESGKAKRSVGNAAVLSPVRSASSENTENGSRLRRNA